MIVLITLMVLTVIGIYFVNNAEEKLPIRSKEDFIDLYTKNVDDFSEMYELFTRNDFETQVTYFDKRYILYVSKYNSDFTFDTQDQKKIEDFMDSKRVSSMFSYKGTLRILFDDEMHLEITHEIQMYGKDTTFNCPRRIEIDDKAYYCQTRQ